MASDALDDLVKDAPSSASSLASHNDAYSNNAFSTFGGLDDGLGTHNPFADLRSPAILNTSSLSSPPPSQPSPPAFDVRSDMPSFQDALISPRVDLVPQSGFGLPDDPAHFRSNGFGSADLEGSGFGFDGQDLEAATDHFTSFPNIDQDLHESSQDHQFQFSHAFTPRNTSPASARLASDSPIGQAAVPSFKSPSSGFQPFRDQDIEPSSTSRHPPSNSPPELPLEPAVFRPFGVTATLTSSSEDKFDEAALPASGTNPSNRPALPDILGGGSLAASALLHDSKSTLPAFKKTPKMPLRASSNGVSSDAGIEDSKSPRPTAGRVTADGPKPYRPLGLKIAHPKPIVALPSPAQSSAKTASTEATAVSHGPPPQPKATPPQKVSSSLERKRTIERNATKQHSAVFSPPRSFASEQSHKSAGDQVPPAAPESQTTVTRSSSASSATGQGIPTDRVLVSPISSSTSQEHPSLVALDPTFDRNSMATPGLSVVASPSPTSVPTVVSEPQEAIVRPSGDPDLEPGPQKLADKPADSSLVGNVPKPCAPLTLKAEGARLRTASESEDERPLASVRDGLVQQQHSQQQPVAGRKEASPNSMSTFSGRLVTNKDATSNWPAQPPLAIYKCSVGDPQKMGMINDIHTVYTVKTRATTQGTSGPLRGSSTVLRRFRDFVWLFEALISNNPGVIVPPIPDKNLRNRFQEGFIAARRVALEIFLQKTVNHPMLMSDPDLKLFLESDSFSLEIKHRKADSSYQHGWFANLAGPRFSETDDFFDQRKMELETFEGQLKALQSSLSNASKARQTLSQCLADLSQALLTLSSCDLSRPVRNALDRLAALHQQFHTWSEEQSRDELEGLVATVETYSRLINSVRLTFSSRVKSWEKWQSSLNTLRKVQATHEKARRTAASEHSTGLMYSLAELEEAERRAHEARNEFGDVAKLIKAEMKRFDKEKVEDFKAAIRSYVDSLTARQKQVVRAWQEYYQLLQALSKHNAGSSGASKPSPSQSLPPEVPPSTDSVSSSAPQAAEQQELEGHTLSPVADNTSAWREEPRSRSVERDALLPADVGGSDKPVSEP